MTCPSHPSDHPHTDARTDPHTDHHTDSRAIPRADTNAFSSGNPGGQSGNGVGVGEAGVDGVGVDGVGVGCKGARPLPALDTEFKPRAAAGTLLVGTLDTLTQLVKQLDAVGSCPEPIGCIVVGQTQSTQCVGTLAGPHNHNLAILGTLDDLPRICDRLRICAAVVSLPSAMSTAVGRVRKALASLGIEERFIVPLGEAMAAGMRQDGWWQPRTGQINPAVLIDREPHHLDRASVARVLRNRRVLITGAGGSIGSELARIAAGFEPEMLILMERSENALFEIDRQIGALGTPHRAILHDIVDRAGTQRLLEELKPDVVFHAAAHKHVPLMEDHPAHAITNNVFGTKSVADAALAARVERFVLISTDKAVHPTSVMGATKRIAEQYVRWLHHREHVCQKNSGVSGSCAPRSQAAAQPTTFSVVRFGNVLGSACSVLPIWAAQIADGKSITVTDPRMTRYFMTIPEAATLVIQAASLSSESPAQANSQASLFVLDMGKPVRILDLAERFVRQQGSVPIVCEDGCHVPARPDQVEIVFTGIRPGEKLYEELAYAQEHLRPTRHPGIRSFDASSESVPDMTAIIDTLDRIRSDPAASAVASILHEQVDRVVPANLSRKAG